MLKIDPRDTYVLVGETVQTIEALDPEINYKVDSIDIPNGSGLKLSAVNLQPFKGLRRVSILHYKGNPQNVDLKMFENLDRIYYLSLYSNKIEKIESSATECVLPNVEMLDLSYNELTNFDFGVIRCSSKLKQLELHDNDIITLENSSPITGSCLWPDLEVLKLTSNKLKLFDASFFSCSSKLNQLWIASNKLTTFGDWASCYWPNLDALFVSNNKLTNFNEKILDCSKRIQDLQLFGNELKSFGSIDPEGNCVSPKMQTIDFSNNQMTEIDLKQFDCANGLHFVSLKNNNITDLSFNLSKSSYPDLTHFDITENQWNCQSLEKVTSGLKEMQFIYEKDANCSEKSVDEICCY